MHIQELNRIHAHYIMVQINGLHWKFRSTLIPHADVAQARPLVQVTILKCVCTKLGPFNRKGSCVYMASLSCNNPFLRSRRRKLDIYTLPYSYLPVLHLHMVWTLKTTKTAGGIGINAVCWCNYRLSATKLSQSIITENGHNVKIRKNMPEVFWQKVKWTVF